MFYEPLDTDGAAHVAEEFAARLSGVVTDAEAAGKSVTVSHWSHPERSMTSKYPSVDRLLEGRSFDLHAWFTDHFLTRDGTSLKAVAPIFGFNWTVDGARGAESQVKIDLARTGGDEGMAAVHWLAAYNESDARRPKPRSGTAYGMPPRRSVNRSAPAGCRA